MTFRMALHFTEDFLRALAAHYGRPGTASREDVEAWVNATLDAAAESIVDDHQQEAPDAQ